MGYNYVNKCQKSKKHVKNIKMAQFEAPIIKEWDFMAVWTFERNKTLLSNKFSIQML